MRYPRTAPMAKSEVLHMISNGLDQSGTDMIGAEISFLLSFSQEFIHSASKVKNTSLANRLVKGIAILLKSLINLW